MRRRPDPFMVFVIIFGVVILIGLALLWTRISAIRNDRGDSAMICYGDTPSDGQHHSDHSSHGHDGGGDGGSHSGSDGGGGPH
jgi:uncharacterized membrane protein YgcG